MTEPNYEETKARFEAAIVKVGRALGALNKTVEGLSLSEEDLEKGFRHLTKLLAEAHLQARFARAVESFSLDAPGELSPLINWQVGPRSVVTEGRLVGQGRPGAPVAHSPRAPVDDPDANSFLEDDEE